MTRVAAGEPARRRTPREVPRLAETLRRVALHEETAALLDARAARAGAPEDAALLQRRAAEHRAQAARLRGRLTGRVG